MSAVALCAGEHTLAGDVVYDTRASPHIHFPSDGKSLNSEPQYSEDPFYQCLLKTNRIRGNEDCLRNMQDPKVRSLRYERSEMKTIETDSRQRAGVLGDETASPY